VSTPSEYALRDGSADGGEQFSAAGQALLIAAPTASLPESLGVRGVHSEIAR
jgi:hypothetical protein